MKKTICEKGRLEESIKYGKTHPVSTTSPLNTDDKRESPTYRDSDADLLAAREDIFPIFCLLFFGIGSNYSEALFQFAMPIESMDCKKTLPLYVNFSVKQGEEKCI